MLRLRCVHLIIPYNRLGPLGAAGLSPLAGVAALAHLTLDVSGNRIGAREDSADSRVYVLCSRLRPPAADGGALALASVVAAPRLTSVRLLLASGRAAPASGCFGPRIGFQAC